MAITPVAPTLSSVTATTFDITVNADGNPSPPATYYSFRLVFNATTKYLNALGQLVDDKVFLPTLSITANNVTPNTFHSVNLTAADDADGLNESAIGPTATATTLAATPIASSYTNIFSTTVMAHWTANGNPSGTEYQVDISPDSSFLSGIITSGWITETGYIFSNLNPNETYYGRVKARNNVLNETAYTLLSSVNTLTGPDTVKVIRVYNLLAERGYLISWQPNQETNIANYKIYRSESPTDAENFKLLGSVNNQVTSYIDKVPFTFGIVWYYVVTAVDDGGNESSISRTTPSHENTYHSFEEQPFPNTVSASDFVKDEKPTGLVDALNALYTTKYPFRLGTVEVFLNGVKLIPVVDFNEGPSSQQITFTDPPNVGGEIRVNYTRFGV